MSPRRLTIGSIETVPIRGPLVRTFQGSHDRMTHRSTIVTRVRTDEGFIGEANAGDEDAGLLEIERIIWWELVANRPRLRAGAVELGDQPGLGWELDEDFIAAHCVDG